MKILWPGPALFVLFWLTLLSVGSRFLQDPGMFWHTVVGDKILSEGFVDRDPFTFTRAGDPWVPYQWLGEVAMAAVHRVGGLDSLLVCATAIVAALFSWLAAKFIRTGLHPIFAVGVTLLAIAAASSHFHVRPHLLTMVAMAITMRAILAYEAGAIGLRPLAWLIPLYWVWTNVHGGMLGGLTTLGLAFAGWLAWRALGWDSPVRTVRTVIGLSAIGIACGITAFLTPYGDGVFRTWMYIYSGMPRLPEIIVEHSRLNFADPQAWPMLAFGVLYLAMLAGTLPNKPRVAWLIPIFWLIQACLRVRHGSLFAVVGMVALIDLWPHMRYAIWFARNRPDVYEPKPATPGTVRGISIAALVCVGLALALQAARVPLPLLGTGCARLEPTRWPTEALDELRAHEPKSPGAGRKIFCEYIYGGYIEYHCPGYRVFVDDRCEVFGDDWLIDFVNAETTGTTEAMARWQAEYGRFDFALTANPSGYGDYFEQRPGEWTMVTKTDRVRFFVRR